jgi:hypothetical protein
VVQLLAVKGGATVGHLLASTGGSSGHNSPVAEVLIIVAAVAMVAVAVWKRGFRK